MVHTFKFPYENKMYYFLWDVESGSLLQVDKVAFLCAKKKFNKELTDGEVKEISSIDSSIIEEIFAEYDELEKVIDTYLKENA